MGGSTRGVSVTRAKLSAGDGISAICSSRICEGEARNQGGPRQGERCAFGGRWKEKVGDAM